MNHLVSVIIPTFNRDIFLEKAILSVLEQSYSRIEIIVVDDGSVDDTKIIVDKFASQVRYYFQENQGVSAARNHGIQHAKGDYIAFLDSDDAWVPEKLERQVNVLQTMPEYSVVLCDYVYIDTSGRKFDECKRRAQFPKNGSIFKDVVLSPYLIPSTLLVRKSALDKAGYFDTSLQTAEDIDLFLRLAANEQVYLLEEPLTLITRGLYGLTDAISSYDDYLGVILNCLKVNNHALSWSIRRRCLFSTYYNFVRGKIWHNAFGEACKAIPFMFFYNSSLQDLKKSFYAIMVLFFIFFKSLLKR